MLDVKICNIYYLKIIPLRFKFIKKNCIAALLTITWKLLDKSENQDENDYMDDCISEGTEYVPDTPDIESGNNYVLLSIIVKNIQMHTKYFLKFL